MPPRLETLSLSKAGSILQQIEFDEQDNFTPAQIQRFKSDPEFYKRFVKTTEKEVNGNFPIVSNLMSLQKESSCWEMHYSALITLLFQMLRDSEVHNAATAAVTQYMRSALGDDEKLIKALIPSFPLGCRRLTPGVGYLESLLQPNVTVVSDPIVRVTSTGLVTMTGETVEVDAIICATGFDVSFCPRFPLVGREGNLQDIWSKDIPRAYMSCAVPDLPNYFGKSKAVTMVWGGGTGHQSFRFWFWEIFVLHPLCHGPSDTLISVPWPQCTDRAWECIHHHRAPCQIHHQHYPKMPDRVYQSRRAQPGGGQRVV